MAELVETLSKTEHTYVVELNQEEVDIIRFLVGWTGGGGDLCDVTTDIYSCLLPLSSYPAGYYHPRLDPITSEVDIDLREKTDD